MSVRSLNKVQLIGNLTRDPELRYTPQGTAVCSFGLATNRAWTTDVGDRREETEFHRIVAWAKLAELCSQLLFKGRRIYVEGRLQTRQWTAQDGAPRSTTEVVIDDMIILDSKHEDGGGPGGGGDNYASGRQSGGYDDYTQGPPDDFGSSGVSDTGKTNQGGVRSANNAGNSQGITQTGDTATDNVKADVGDKPNEGSDIPF